MTHLSFTKLSHDGTDVSILMKLQPTSTVKVALLKRVSQSKVDKARDSIKGL
jgi:hypothetical protein